MKLLLYFFLFNVFLQKNVNSLDSIIITNPGLNYKSCDYIVENCNVNYIKYNYINGSLLFNSSKNMILDNNTYTLNNISSTNKMLISNFDIKPNNFTYCVDFICKSNKKNYNKKLFVYRLVIVIISIILLLLSILPVIYIYRNKTNHIVNNNNDLESPINFNYFNQYRMYHDEQTNEDDFDILYKEDFGTLYQEDLEYQSNLIRPEHYNNISKHRSIYDEDDEILDFYNNTKL